MCQIELHLENCVGNQGQQQSVLLPCFYYNYIDAVKVR